jgi:hypothetical protein
MCVCVSEWVCVCVCTHALGVWVCLHVYLHVCVCVCVCVTISVLTPMPLYTSGIKVRWQIIWMIYEVWSATHEIRGRENSQNTWLGNNINETGWKAIIPVPTNECQTHHSWMSHTRSEVKSGTRHCAEHTATLDNGAASSASLWAFCYWYISAQVKVNPAA